MEDYDEIDGRIVLPQGILWDRVREELQLEKTKLYRILKERGNKSSQEVKPKREIRRSKEYYKYFLLRKLLKENYLDVLYEERNMREGMKKNFHLDSFYNASRELCEDFDVGVPEFRLPISNFNHTKV